MELSGVIFVALAIAWAVYLIPKALQHHDEAARSRSVERFSESLRVLARREPVNARDARLVVTPGRTSAPVVETKPVQLTPAQLRARREASRKATQRRRRVLGLILLANLAVVGVAAFSLISWWWVAAPTGLLVAWLVACRVMVKSERAALAPRVAAPVTETAEVDDTEDELPEPHLDVETNDQGFTELAATSETAVTPAVVVGDPHLWDPLPMTLPTYVNKPAAERRSVRTISIDDSGVWTSGRTEQDAAIARRADAERAASREAGRDADGSDQRAVGS